MSDAPDASLYILACDHRRSFERLLGVRGTPIDGDVERIIDAKELIWEGFQQALAGGVSRASAGILLDLQYGERIAREAKRLGITFAIPVEKSGQPEFEFEHGEQFAGAIEDIAPTYVKALVRYNVEGDIELNARQRERLNKLSSWLAERPYRFLLELLVPPEPSQLEHTGDDGAGFENEMRPGLIRSAIEELQDAGIEPDVWKVEGLDERVDCRTIADLVQRNGRRSYCVVLGRGASLDKVDEWIRAARGLPGYVGFAVGRSIFTDALSRLPSGRLATRDDARTEIARNFRRLVSTYES